MHDAIDALIHDAASLHRLVDFIHQYCNEQRTSQTYVDATDEFFGYIDRLATGTKEFLRISTSKFHPSPLRNCAAIPLPSHRRRSAPAWNRPVPYNARADSTIPRC